MKINKNNLKKFLKSEYSIDIKLFILLVLESLDKYPADNMLYVYYIFDLNLIDDIKLDNESYLIDFDYLNSLDKKIMKYYLDLLTSGIKIDTFNFIENSLQILISHGILITNIEYLKRKREYKLNKINYNNEEEDLNNLFH